MSWCQRVKTEFSSGKISLHILGNTPYFSSEGTYFVVFASSHLLSLNNYT